MNNSFKILKVPFSGGGLGKGNGSNFAPDLIVKKLDAEVVSLDLDESNIQESHDRIEKAVSSFEKGVILGGDHSITYPAVKGFAENVPDFNLIVFDAHPDLMDNFVPPSHEDYLRVLIEKGVVKAEDVVLVGIRNWDKIEMDYIEEKGIKYITSKEILEKGVETITNEIKQLIGKPIYLSLDIDVIDSCEAPGTGYCEENGISSEQLIFFLKNVPVKMADVVEVNPKKDVGDKTSSLAAKIISEIILC